MDFALSRVMEAFDGKNKIVQHQIANVINNKAINDDTPIYDFIAKYRSSIAATGDGEHHGVGSVDGRCNYCRQKSHTKDNCPKKSAAARKAAADSRIGTRVVVVAVVVVVVVVAVVVVAVMVAVVVVISATSQATRAPRRGTMLTSTQKRMSSMWRGHPRPLRNRRPQPVPNHTSN